MGVPSLPYRVRPLHLVLAVGAVLVVSAAAALASAYGGPWGSVLLLGPAVLATLVALLSHRLRTSSDTLAATGAALALAGAAIAGSTSDDEPIPAAVLPAVLPAVLAAVLAALFLGLHRLQPRTAVWPLASWAAVQLAVLRLVDDLPAALHTAAYVLVALLGLGVAVGGRPVVGRIALVTTAPWWVAGVLSGSASAWTDEGARPWTSALLVGVAAAALLPARLRRPLDPLLGHPRGLPIVAGTVSGAAAVGPFSALDPHVLAMTGFLGVLLATVPAASLTGWRRGMLAPATVAAGGVVAGLCLVQLAAAGHWSALWLLLLLTALATVPVGVRRPEERPVALPTIVGCLGAVVLLFVPDGILGPSGAATLLTALYGTALAAGAGLDGASRRATARMAGSVAVVALALVAADGDRWVLAGHLALQGACTLGWAWRAGGVVAWRTGAAQLVGAAWVLAAAADLHHVEWYTVSAAAGLRIAAGRASDAPSWPTWGPALLAAVVPSAALAVLAPDAARAVVVLVVAAVAMVLGTLAELRAPLEVGVLAALWIAAGIAVRTLPWPLATAVLVGTLLLAFGMHGERRSVPGFGARLADLR